MLFVPYLGSKPGINPKNYIYHLRQKYTTSWWEMYYAIGYDKVLYGVVAPCGNSFFRLYIRA